MVGDDEESLAITSSFVSRTRAFDAAPTDASRSERLQRIEERLERIEAVPQPLRTSDRS